jgi:hypothetical protein
VQKSKDENVLACSNQILNFFMSDICNNLEYVLDDISKLMSMITIMMSSKSENVAHNAHKQLRAIITLFSQILDLQVDDNNRDLMLERGQLVSISKVVKERINPDRLLASIFLVDAVVLMPAIAVLFSGVKRTPKELEANISLGMEIFKGFNKQMSKGSWLSVFSEILDPFIGSMLEHLKEQDKGSVSPKEDPFLRIFKATVKDFFYSVKDTNEDQLMVEFVLFLQRKTIIGDKVRRAVEARFYRSCSKRSWWSCYR